MPIHTILPSFGAGELSPSLYGRVDLEKYAIGCKTLKNFFVHSHGGVSNRQGTEYIATVKDSTKYANIIPFEYSTEQAYVIEFGDRYCRFYKDGGQIIYTAAGMDDFDPAYGYITGMHSKVGPYIKLDCGASKYLYVAAPYGLSTATGIKVAVEINTSDVLELSTASDTITIKLANATASKNAANLIQVLLRDLATVNGVSVALWTVTENAAYAAARPTAAVTIAATNLSSFAKLYKNILNTSESSTNTNYLPPDNATYWEEVIINDPVEITTPYLDTDLIKLRVSQSADVLYITHPNYAPRELTRYSHIDWSLTDFNYKNGPFFDENLDTTRTVTPSAKTGTINLTSNFNIFDATHVGSLWKISHDVEGQTMASSLAASGTRKTVSGTFTGTGQSASAYCLGTWNLTMTAAGWGSVDLEKSTDGGTTWTVVDTYTSNTTESGTITELCLLRLNCTAHAADITYSLIVDQAIEAVGNDITSVKWRFISHGTWTGKVHIEKSIDNGVTWTKLQSYSSTDDYNISTADTETENCWLRVNMYSYTSGTMSYDFFIDTYQHNGVIRIASVVNSRSATAIVIYELGGITASKVWAEGAWSDYRGFPSCVAFYQDRLFFGATNTEPQKFWASQTGDYNNFGVSTEVLDSDSISRSLMSRKVNKIYSMVGLGEIITLTSSANWLVGSGGSDISLTPASVKGRCQGFKGSADIEPVVIDNRVVYIQSQGSVLRDLGYSLESDSYVGDNLSIMSNHLTKDNTIIQMAYQQDPDSIIWIVRDDGILLGVTYIREQQVLAWHRHETDGEFENVCTIPGDGYDEVWFVVKRGTNRFIERFVKRMASTETEDQVFLDSSLTATFSPAANIISGLDHLEGETVYALCDGFVFADLTVSSGEITLPNGYEASKATVGLQYNADFEPLNIEVPLNNGTSQGRHKHISELIIRFENSLGGWVGPDENHLDELIQRTDEPLDSPVDLQTGDYRHPMYGDWTENNTFFFRQIDPLPVTILAVIGKVEYGG